MRSRVLLGTLFGAIGGFIGFLLQEALVAHDPVLLTTKSDMMRLGAMVGAALGTAIGLVEGTAVGSPRLMARGAVIGLLVGAVGGVVGILAGGMVFNVALMGQDQQVLATSHSMVDFAHEVLARALGWTFLGAFPGMAAGAATLSSKRALHGLAGGLLGGFLGGIVFDLASVLIATPAQEIAGSATGQKIVEVGGPGRAIGFTLIGALTGLFIGLVEEYLKQAWVRVLAGRNEGRDIILSKPVSILGRDERADVPLYGDPAVAPQHAAIRAENGRHVLMDGGSPLGSVVNGAAVPGHLLLKDGDMIQLGQVRILFREKATAAFIRAPAPDSPKTAAGGGLSMPAHLCPFCGAQKDASGNCLCTVHGAVPGSGMATAAPSYANEPQYMSAPPASVPVDLAGGWGAPQAAINPGAPASASATAGGRLTAIAGPYSGQSFAIGQTATSLGRDVAKDISLALDTTVSRNHAHIGFEAGVHVLYDDGSSNGTFVNGVRITMQTLSAGDQVSMGASQFRYE